MKITDLEIDRFGVWRDLTLPLSGAGLNVFYGPNEAGKSTLKRFVRAMLFGGPLPEERTSRISREEVVSSGALRITHALESFRLHRRMTGSGIGHLELTGPHNTVLPDEKLDDLLSGTSEAVFDRLFAIDLFELQELARLDHRELAGHVYGLSLGTHGQRLLNAVEDLSRHKEQLCSADGTIGRLPELIAEEQSLIGQMRALPNIASARGDLLDERDRVDAEIANLKRRRNDVEREVRGRRFVDRVHPAWRQVRDYRSQLSRFSSLVDLPPDGLMQLEALDREADSHSRKRDDSRARAADAERRSEALGPEPEIIRSEPVVRAMLGMRSWVQETLQARSNAPRESNIPTTAPSMIRPTGTVSLGVDWPSDRLAAVDTTPRAQMLLLEAARRYRLALGRRSVLRKRYRANQNTLSKREALVQERLNDLGKSPDAVAAELRRDLASLESRETLAELRTKEAIYAQRSGIQRRRAEKLADSFEIPPWVSAVLALFALGGAIFAFLGLVTGVTHSAVAGAAYLLLGLTSGSIAIKLRSHFEGAIEQTTEQIRDERHDDEIELRKVREEIQRLGAMPTRDGTNVSRALATTSGLGKAKPSIADHVRGAVKQFGEIDEVVSAQARIQSRRKDLTALRARLRKVQRDVEAARQEWCQTLVRVGLPESLEIDESLETWQTIAENMPERVVTVAADPGESHQLLDMALANFGAELETLGRQLGFWKGSARHPLEILENWENQLDRALAESAERRRHWEEHERHLAAASKCEERLAELARQQTALLAAAGVRSRADYEARLREAEEREELRELLQLSELELESMASAEPELAIVEEDLLAFRAEESRDALLSLLQEQEGLETRLEAAHERRGQILHRLEELAGDCRGTDLSRRKARIESILERMSSRLLAVGLASEAAEEARLAYERDHQPAVLQAASEVMARLTRNRYTRIWSPLGERTLRVDDDQQRTFSIDRLSGGTREQLLLALRLGMVKRAAEQGIELPLILDDVFVNFDQLRTEAAFETLQELAEEGRQILFFTCHLHLAHLAEQRGVAPIWLPGHEGAAKQRMAG